MSKPILMPQVGQDLEEGKLVEWRVKLGDIVKKGDIVAVVESEKASFEVEAFEAGTVVDLLYEEGATTKVLAPLLFVGEESEAAKVAETATPEPVAPAPAAPARAAASPAAPAPAQASPATAPVDAAAVVESAAVPGAVEGTPPPAAVADAMRPDGKAGRSSPLARRLAGSAGLDLGSVAGTGPRGAVVRRDIDKALQARPAPVPAVDRPPVPERGPSAPVRAPEIASADGALHRVWLRKGQGDPVVLIHGFGADHNAWRVLAAAANLSRPVLAVDLPGHGRSPDGASTLDAMAAAVASTLEQEGVASADLVGHSLGAAVAVALAESARFTVRSLFLLAPAGLGPDINGDFLAGFARARSEATLAPWMKLLVADEAAMGQAIVRVTAETRARPGVADAQQRIADAVFPDGTQVIGVRKALEALPMPIRIVVGAVDRIIPARHAAGLPGTVALHVFPGVGHMPFLEAREPVARLLGEHLRSVL